MLKTVLLLLSVCVVCIVARGEDGQSPWEIDSAKLMAPPRVAVGVSPSITVVYSAHRVLDRPCPGVEVQMTATVFNPNGEMEPGVTATLESTDLQYGSVTFSLSKVVTLQAGDGGSIHIHVVVLPLLGADTAPGKSADVELPVFSPAEDKSARPQLRMQELGPWSVFSTCESPTRAEEEAKTVAELRRQPPESCEDPGRLKYSNSSDALRLLMEVAGRYKKGDRSDSTLLGCIQALSGILERTHNSETGRFLIGKYAEWDSEARRNLLIDYPFTDDLVELLRGALVEEADGLLRLTAALRIRDHREGWEPLRGLVQSRLAAETDPKVRYALSEASEAMGAR